MTQNRRIILNVVATYGRSLFGLACGLFTTRWVLEALGHINYGLYGLVGGLTVFIVFFNGLMTGATSRFYAFSVGAARIAANSDEGLSECRAWFNTALMVHTCLPLLLVCIGYPIGYKVVTEYLTIPAERMESCIWVLRYVTISCFVSMVNVPFQAMYTAKQYIAELTIYSFVQTFCTFFFAWYMVAHTGEWLVRYALYMSLLQVVPQLIICVRALKVFPECKIDFKYWGDFGRVRKMWSYAGWQAFAGIGGICRGQGMAILSNKYFGPQINASMSIANHVSVQSQTLTAAMIGAFQPAITQACGAKEYELMRIMAFRACKFGTLLTLVFALPLAIEVKSVLALWLNNPPPYTVELCLCMIGVLLIDKSSIGQMVAVNAKGKVAIYQSFLGTALILTLPTAWALICMKIGVCSIGYAFLLCTALSAWGRVYFARTLVGMSARHWMLKIFLPIVISMLVSTLVGLVPRLSLPPSVARIIVTTVCVETTLLPLAWFVVLSENERKYLRNKILTIQRRVCGK